MLRSLRSVFTLLAVVTAPFLLGGCGGGTAGTVDVNGKLILPTNVKLNPTDSIAISFMPNKEGKVGGGSVNLTGNDSTFSLKVPPGEYKIAVTIRPYPGDKGADTRQQTLDKSFGTFSAMKTPMKYEVTDAPQQSITLDLVKGMATKN